MPFRTLRELDHTEGTVRLYESNTHDTFTHLKGTNTVLIPQPSNDINDPLRWPMWKKYVAFINVCCFCFLTNASIGGLSPAFYGLSLEFQTSVATTTQLLTWAILVLGVGNFFWVPTAIYFGKRPVFVVASLLLCVSNIWAASAKTFGSLLGSRVVAACAGSSTEALGAAIVNDIFFLHERGNKMGIYIIFLSWGNSLGPLAAGFVVAGPGWRWFCWVCAILTGVNFLSILLFVPETRFARDVDQAMVGADSTTDDLTAEKGQGVHVHDATMASPLPEPQSYGSSTTKGTSKTWAQQLSPWSGIDKHNTFFELFLRPWPLLAYPAVFWTILGYSVSLAWVIAVGTVNSFILQAPPYNFSAGINGLINIPAMIGNAVGAFTGGYLTDVYSRWRAKRNSGVFEPETRLHLLIVPALCVPAGLLMFGFGVQDRLSWAVLFVGYGFISVGITGVANIGMTYVMDSYFPVAAEALLLVNGLKNVVAFGFTYGAVPWITKDGYQKVFGAMAGIFLGILALAIPLIVYGRRIRHYSGWHLKLIIW